MSKTYEDAWKEQHKFEDPHGWIQWKGTNICMDVYCVCGHHSHVDGYFCYQVKCPVCEKTYFCNGNIQLIEIQEEDPSKPALEDESPEGEQR